MPDEQRSFFTIIRYIDAPAAIEWLQSAFGFEKVLEIEGAGGTIDFAHLALEGDVIGTGTAMSDVRHAIACHVADPEVHFERAKAVGAKIGREIEETEFGARIYLTSDLAGNAWSFGTYRPPQKTGSVIFPCFTYRDAGDAIRWLADAFGLEKQAAFTEHGQIVHAEMSFGESGIMFGSMREEEPDNPWANAPFGIYVRVSDIDAHYEQAKAAGAEIIRELNDTSYGAREYSARDPEGNLWSFGTYLPEWSKAT